MTATFSSRYWASMVRNEGMVMVPDYVANEWPVYDYETDFAYGPPFPVKRGDGTTSRAVLQSLPAGGFSDGSAVVKIL